MSKKYYFEGMSIWSNLGRGPFLFLVGACVLALCVVMFVGFSCTSHGETRQSTEKKALEQTSVDSEVLASDTATKTPLATMHLASTSVDGASSTHRINRFSSSGGTAQALATAEIQDILDAIGAFGDKGYEVGFVVLDLQSGQGLGYNADAEIFSASTIKAPFTTFVLQSLIDNGIANESDHLDKDFITEGTGVMIDDDETGYDLETVIADTIKYSDNTGYAMMRNHYEAEGWIDWVRRAGVQSFELEDELYPYYSARDLAKFWIATISYLASDSESADKLEALFGDTQTSFLRKALNEKHSVFAKAGFEIDTDALGVGALNDAGIVKTDKGNYLIAIMSDADYDIEFLTDNEPLIINLITALDIARDNLFVA